MLNKTHRIITDTSSTNPQEAGDDKLSISIKSSEYWLGNGILTFFLVAVIPGGIFLVYLVFTRMSEIPSLFPVSIALTVAAFLMVTRKWLWHLFGEELFEVKDNRFCEKKFYGLYTSKEKYLDLNSSTDLYVNKLDNWSWKELREKGVFRMVNGSKTLDFGIDLNEKEYEMLLSQVNNIVNKYKETPSRLISDTTPQYPSPPPLEVQLDGKLEEEVNAFYKKYSGGEDEKEKEEKDKNKTQA
ncbi:MAG: hypothetical protein ABII90_13340 [Bacteroidota bacterium]